MILEGEEGQTHVGENEVLCQEIQQFEKLQHIRDIQGFSQWQSLIEKDIQQINMIELCGLKNSFSGRV